MPQPSPDDLFAGRAAGVDCPMCPDGNDADVAAELKSGRVHLQNDADYPGYCILVFRRHAIELFELTQAERREWIDDIALVGRAIWEVCAPLKLNLSMLGNLCPHLHCHLMPRYSSDPEWCGPPRYRSADEKRPLAEERYVILLEQLRLKINQGTISLLNPV